MRNTCWSFPSYRSKHYYRYGKSLLLHNIISSILIQRDNNEISCEISIINFYANCVWSVVCTLAGSVHRQWAIYTRRCHYTCRIVTLRVFFTLLALIWKKDLMLTKQPLIWFDSSSMDECNYREPPMCRTFYHRFVRHPVYMTTVNMQISILLYDLSCTLFS